jgi:large subunit ribosomal protein L19e
MTNLRTKKELAARTLKIGKERIVFVKERHEEIKEAITKQDIRDLVQDKAIVVKPVKGRKTNVKRKNQRGPGKIKKKVKTRKQDYVKMTRKLRAYVKALQARGELSKEQVVEIRKKIRNKDYRSKAHLKEIISGGKK